MCLVLVAYRAHPDLSLCVLANRDETYDRPTAPAAFWDDAPEVLAGRDLSKGGTWMGVTRAGRFAALTNVRDPAARREGRSRGEIVRRFLTGQESPPELAASLDRASYPSFNLLCGTPDALYSLRDDAPGATPITPGVHGLSNHRLDTPWPKVETGMRRLTALLARPASPGVAELFGLLDDRGIYEDADLPHTGVPIEWERPLSAAFIRTPAYGTRCSTVLCVHVTGRVAFEERSFDREGALIADVRETFELR